MKKLTTAPLLLILLAFMLTGCGVQRVTPGHTGVFASLQGDEKGGIEEVGVGRYWYNSIQKDLYIFPNYVQRVAWTKSDEEGSPKDESIRVMSQDQLEFVSDIGFSYYVSASQGCSATVFSLYRKDIETITNGPLRDIVRKVMQEEFSQRPASEIYGDQRSIVVDAIDDGVQRRLDEIRSTETGEPCFVIEDFAVLRIDPPTSVKQAVERKIQAAQAAQEERENLLKITYQSRQDSIKAVMDARNNRLLASSITPALLEYEKLQLMKQKWDGVLPRVVSGDGGGLIVDLGNN